VAVREGQRKRPTQADVARVAHVSQPVVSYVLSGDPGAPVAPATRQRVLDAIQRLGYVPNHAARSLRHRRTFTIAGAIPDITNPFYPAFERGIQDVAAGAGYDLITYNTDGAAEKERKFLRSALTGRFDGVIVRLFKTPLSDCLQLVKAGVSVVALTSEAPPAGAVPIDTVAIDGAAAARAAVAYLITRGHRRIGVLAGEAGSRAHVQRTRGYREALAEGGILVEPTFAKECEFTEAGGYAATQELLKLGERPTAFFATNDLVALGALMALREAGLHVPDDVAVVGFDDIPFARLVDPPLTTIAQYPERLGARAAELLLERINGSGPPAGRRELLPFDLIIRQSA
jgi:LacI family transcriptional regulator